MGVRVYNIHTVSCDEHIYVHFNIFVSIRNVPVLPGNNKQLIKIVRGLWEMYGRHIWKERLAHFRLIFVQEAHVSQCSF